MWLLFLLKNMNATIEIVCYTERLKIIDLDLSGEDNYTKKKSLQSTP